MQKDFGFRVMGPVRATVGATHSEESICTLEFTILFLETKQALSAKLVGLVSEISPVELL